GIQVFGAQPSCPGGSHGKLRQRALYVARMVDPGLAGVHAGECEICGATAEEKEDYGGGQSRIHLSNGGHSRPEDCEHCKRSRRGNVARLTELGTVAQRCRMVGREEYFEYARTYPAAEASGSLITSTSTNSLTLLVRSRLNTSLSSGRS